MRVTWLPSDEIADFQIDLVGLDDAIRMSITQRWLFAGLDPQELLAGRPLLTEVLTARTATTFDSASAAALGIELAGCLPALLRSNRDHIGIALGLVEECAGSVEVQIRVTRLATPTTTAPATPAAGRNVVDR